MGAWSARTLDGDDGGVAGRRRRRRRRSGRHERRAGRRSSRCERGADRRVRRARAGRSGAGASTRWEPTRRLPCPARRASCAPRSSPPPSRSCRARPSGPRRAGELLLAGVDRLRDRPGERVRAGATVLATGAYDRPVAFPGWTLPGVMTAGGAQALAKGQGVVPGRRVLLAGAGPFLLPVAAQLAASGAEVVAVAEATRRRDWARVGPRMSAHPGRLRDYVALPHEGAPDRVGPRARARGGPRPRRVRDDRALRPGLGADRRRADLRGRRRLHRLRLPAVRGPRPRARLRAARRRGRARRRHGHVRAGRVRGR